MRAGLRPLLLERRPALCTLTTAVAAGGFRLQQDDEEDLALARESVELFLNFAEVTGQRDHDPAVRQPGYLWVTSTEEGAERQRHLVERQRTWGLEDVDLLTGGEARAAFPFLGPDVVQARFRAGDGLIDPKALTLGLAAGACSAGASVLTGCGVSASPPAEDVPLDHGFAFQLLDPASPVALARFTPFWRRVWQRGAGHWFLQAGQYTMTPDRRPLIGPTDVPGLFVNTGYSGHGVMNSPAGARRIVDLITGTSTPEAGADPFRLDRSFDRLPEVGLL